MTILAGNGRFLSWNIYISVQRPISSHHYSCLLTVHCLVNHAKRLIDSCNYVNTAANCWIKLSWKTWSKRLWNGSVYMVILLFNWKQCECMYVKKANASVHYRTSVFSSVVHLSGTMIHVRMLLLPGSSPTGSASRTSNRWHRETTVLLSLVATTSCRQKNHSQKEKRVSVERARTEKITN